MENPVQYENSMVGRMPDDTASGTSCPAARPSGMEYRFAEPADCGIILGFIRELAEYEHMADEVVATEELLREWIFEKKKAEVIFALENGEPVGFALFTIIIIEKLCHHIFTVRISAPVSNLCNFFTGVVCITTT